mgnify:CR=1 FL=1
MKDVSITTTEDRFDGEGGVRIFYRSWLPAEAPKAVLVLQHGFNSHSGLYDRPAREFAAAGFAVYACDLRGRGQSDGERFYVEDFSEYVSDLSRMVDLARSRHPSLKIFLLGHSAGGVVSCMYALDRQDGLAGLVCESFAYKVPAPDFALAAIRGLAHVFPHAHVLKLKNEDFSRDPAVVAVLNADPLIANETQPTQTVAQMSLADNRLSESFGLFHLPLLIIHGSEDHATRPDGSREFFAKAGSADKTLKIYEGHFHDLLADVGREEVMADIRDWLNRHL